MILKVIECQYMLEYSLKISFNNGKIINIDLSDELWGEIYEPLKDIDFFKKYKIDLNTICWPNGADFAPEFLLEKGKVISMESIPTSASMPM